MSSTCLLLKIIENGILNLKRAVSYHTIEVQKHSIVFIEGGSIMANSLVQVRIDEQLKEDAINIYEELGMDLSTEFVSF